MARSTDITPVPVDANGWKLGDRGRDFFVTTESLTTAHKDIILAQDCKEIAIVVNSGTLYFRGTLPGTRVFLAASAVVDHTTYVSLTTTGNHGFTVGDTVVIAGTTNYNGSYAVVTGSATTELRISATYVAETPATTAYVDGYRDGSTTLGTGPLPIVKEAGEVCMTVWAADTGTITIYGLR